MRRGLGIVVAASFVAAGCGNFFPNPDNVQLPSGVRNYELVCAPAMTRVDCEGRAAMLVDQKRIEQPARRVVKVNVERGGSYTITFSDGSAESMIVN
jgi:hypothetical protein